MSHRIKGNTLFTHIPIHYKGYAEDTNEGQNGGDA
jgi:hypothetical protein